MLKTWRFGYIKIIDKKSINNKFDIFIDTDYLEEWAYYQLVSGEIVAVDLTI